MKIRDEKYRAVREKYFQTEVGRSFLRELSIDELPGLTTPETTAVMLALSLKWICRSILLPQLLVFKNIPYPNNEELGKCWNQYGAMCESFGVSIGFHSGSGKSAENYQVVGSDWGEFRNKTRAISMKWV